MKTNHAVAPLLLSLLASLASLATAQGKPDRQDIDVTVVNGQTVVKEEVAHTTEAHGALVWRIAQPGYAFAANGINIASGGKHKCAMHGDGKRYRCAKLGHDKGAKYKYDVRLVDTATKKDLPPLDPYLLND